MPRIIEKRLSLHKSLANKLRRNEELESQVAQLQALANIGYATYMIAHEINNLLTPMGSYAALALNNPEDKTLTAKALQKATRNCENASKIMESILAVANGQTQEKETIHLTKLVEEVFTCLCRDFKKDRIIVNTHIAEDLTVHAVAVQLQQALMNLVLNARDAMLPQGGVLDIRAGETIDFVEIEIADTGSGIEQANLKRVFEPFFTNKADKKSPSQHSGSGLGLAFCKKIIDAHNGSISVKSKKGKGTTFKITLPNPKKGNS